MIDLVLFGLLAAMWGGSFVAIKFVVAAVPPLFGAMLRVSVALASLGAIFAWQRRGLSVPSKLRARMWLAGLFAQGLPFLLLFWGEQRISAGLAGIINGTVPLFVFCMGLARGAEHFTRRKTAGLLLGFAGIVVICSPVLSFSGTRDEALGTTAVFGMAVCYAIGSLMTRSLLSGRAKADFRANAFHQNCGSVAFLVAASALLERWPAPAAVAAAPSAVAGVLYLGVLSTAVAFLIYFHLIREWGAVRASAVTYVAPVVALFWDWVFFRTVPPPFEVIGVAAILSGVVLLHEPPPASGPAGHAPRAAAAVK